MGRAAACNTDRGVAPLADFAAFPCKIESLHLYNYNRILILYGVTMVPDKTQHFLAFLVNKNSHFKVKDLEGTPLYLWFQYSSSPELR